MTTKTVSVPRDLCSKKAFELGLGMMNGPLENFQDRKHHISGSELWKLEYISKIKKKLSGTYPNSINLGCPRNNISLCDMDNNLFSLETCLLGPDFFFTPSPKSRSIWFRVPGVPGCFPIFCVYLTALLCVWNQVRAVDQKYKGTSEADIGNGNHYIDLSLDKRY